jgi:hypothetical protein
MPGFGPKEPAECSKKSQYYFDFTIELWNFGSLKGETQFLNQQLFSLTASEYESGANDEVTSGIPMPTDDWQ